MGRWRRKSQWSVVTELSLQGGVSIPGSPLRGPSPQSSEDGSAGSPLPPTAPSRGLPPGTLSLHPFRLPHPRLSRSEKVPGGTAVEMECWP